MIGYKLFNRRKDETLGPLFIDRTLRLTTGIWYHAKDVPTKGYAHRPGWHICHSQSAPHLSKKNRVWALVEFESYEQHQRPEHQGGLWYTAKVMRILEVLPNELHPL